MYSLLFIFLFTPCIAELVRYISIEHPHATYTNPKYFTNVKMSSRRYLKSDPKYYVDMHFTSKFVLNNTLTLSITFYKFTNNVYKLTFFEVSYKWCDFIENDMFLGAGLRQGNMNRPCPFPPGDYHVNNATIPIHSMPPTFPFVKGKICINLTINVGAGRIEQTAMGYFHLEIKTMRIKSKV